MVAFHIHVEPSAGPAPVAKVVASAKDRVEMNAYMLTSRAVLRSITRDCRRGVKVEVILETRPYGGKRIVRRERRALSSTCATVHAPPGRFLGRYVYSHAKYVVTDPKHGGRASISTGNFTWTSFHKDRDYVLTTRDGSVVHSLDTVFRADWNHKRAGDGPRHHLVLSPGAEPALAHVISQPGPVWIEAEELGDAPRILKAIAAKGGDAHLVLPASEMKHASGRIAKLEKAGVDVRLAHKPYMHAKAIVGPRLTYMGSVNFSRSSLYHNREVGVLLPTPKIMLRRVREDWTSAKPAE